MISLDAWLVFVIIGLLLIVIEAIIGVEAGYDLVMIGSAFVIGGLVTMPFNSWLVTSVIVSVVCVAYVALGRKYVHRIKTVDAARTNVDAIIGKRGVVLQSIARNMDGVVKVENERWRARSEDSISEGEEIIVTGLSGVTLLVNKPDNGGDL